MANEFIHKAVGPVLTQAEFENVDQHVLSSQATGDLVHAVSATSLQRIPIGNVDDILTVVGGVPAWVASGGGSPHTLDSHTDVATIVEARGQILLRTATEWDALAIGASGTFLKSDGTDPAWSTLVVADIPPTGLTLFVAASNASARSIARADFICDGTDDHVQILAAFAALAVAGGVVQLSEGLFTIGAALGIPSLCWLRGRAGATIIKNASVAGNRMIEPENFTTVGGVGDGDTDITISDLTIDANGDGTLTNNHTIYMTSVLRLRMRDVRCINGGNFAASIYRCDDVVITDFSATSGATGGLDGLHLWDTKNAIIDGVKGVTGDDVFSVTSDSFDIESIVATNIRGSSSTANIVRVTAASTFTASNIHIHNITCDSAAARGVILGAIDGTLQDSSFTGISVHDTALQGIAASGTGFVARVYMQAIIKGPATTSGGLFFADAVITDSVFDLIANDCRTNNPAVKFSDISGSRISLICDFVNGAKTLHDILFIDDGDNNNITGGTFTGGLRSIEIGSGVTTPTNNHIHGNTFDNASQNVIKEAGNADSNIYEGNIFLNNPSVVATGLGASSRVRNNTGSTIDGVIPDPGNGNAIAVTASGHVPLVTVAAETRTIADADAPGLTLDLFLKTDGGDCVITFASPYNDAGDTVLTLSAVGELVRLISIEDGADFEWRVDVPGAPNGIATLDANGDVPDAQIPASIVRETAVQTLTNKTLDDFSNDIHADDIHIQARNQSGGTLTKGTPVYVSGFNIGLAIVLVDKADSNGSGTMPAIGLVDADIANNATGGITSVGTVEGLNTVAFTIGDVLYVSETAGELTATRPTAVGSLVQSMGEVLRVHGSNGIIEVEGAGRTNDSPNTVAPTQIILPNGAAPTPATEADVQWETDRDVIVVGDGSGQKFFMPVVDATSDPLIDGDAAADGTEDTGARKDHVHPKHHAKYTDAEAISAVEGEGTLILSGVVTFTNTGLHILDTDASHDLIVKPGSNLTADRTLTITTGDADRTFTLSGNLTVEATSIVNQDLSSDASPSFAGVALSGQNALELSPFGVSAGETGEARFLELAAGGTAYVGFKAADALAGNVIWTLPNSDSTGSQFLQSDGSGVLSWSTPAGSGDVVGPGASVDNEIVRYDGTTGKAIQAYTSGGPTISDTGLISFTQLITGAVAGNVLSFQNTTDGVSNQVGILSGGNRSTALDNDEAYLTLRLDDDLGALTEFVRLTWKALDVTNDSKDSRPEFQYYTSNILSELSFPPITSDDVVVVATLAQTLANKTLVGPIIADLTNATHDHADAAGGGTIAHATTTGQGVDDHHSEAHAAAHADGGADELAVQDLASDAATDGQVAKADGAGAVAFEDDLAGVSFIIDGGGSAITTGIKGDIEIPFNCIIEAVRMFADQSGSIVVDIWNDAYADLPPENAETITASTPPTITTAIKSEDATLTSWLTTLVKGDWLRFNVDSITTIERVTVSLSLKKT